MIFKPRSPQAILLVFRKFIDLSQELKHIISTLLAESSHFNVNDVLVDIHHENPKLHFISDSSFFGKGIPFADFPKKMLADARLSRKESGVNTLCFARGVVRLKVSGKDVLSPILLTPISYSSNRIQQEVHFQEMDDASFLNPFIVSHFRREFNRSIPQELIEQPELTTLAQHFESIGLQVELETSVVGNFHHHRYQVLKELEDLQAAEILNPTIGTLFGNEQVSIRPLQLTPTNLFPADTDHEAVFAATSDSHVVVQGPPGTGKSQVICNLIGKGLAANQTILAVSEKRAALEVIESKLQSMNFDTLCFIAGSDRQSHEFLENLKRSWDFFESYQPNTDINLQLSEQYEDNLQMTLDLLNQTDLIGGVSFHDFLELSKGKELTGTYSSTAPTVSQFIQHKDILSSLFDIGIHKVVSYLRKKTLISADFLQFDQRIHALQEQLIALQGIFVVETWNDLSTAMKEAAICQVFENELFKRYSEIFTPESKVQKRFLRLAKQYVSLSNDEEIGSEWIIYPSVIESESLLKLIQQGSFFEKRRAKKRWKQLSTLPFSEAVLNLERRLSAGQKEERLKKCLSRLKKIGIEHPEQEIEQIQQSISLFSEEKWSLYMSIPVEQRAKITAHHSVLSDVHHLLQSSFKLDGNTILLPFLSDLKSHFSEIVAEHQTLLELDDHELLSLRECSTFNDYETLVLTSNYTLFKERFPSFSSFEPDQIREKVRAILSAQSSEAEIHAHHLLNAIHEQFTKHHTLLNTPANRLSEEQKVLKKALRKGKSILVKEFGKTRSHPTLRELFASEARHWISLLKPIWLSNPSSLANCFPMEQHCFDWVIFDEASQIPIQHALGAIQRCDRIIVAGDEHQMGPSHYFQSGSSGLTDLLHQASYHFQKVPLLHHYRSVHPELIAFSNKHFYDGKLKAYPSAKDTDHPIRHHFIENAVFENRSNLAEAKAVAAHLSLRLKEQKSLGIVAFSEEQLSCIWRQLDSSQQNELLIHQETHGGFFKALENVQGDECDSLIISFGYAPNTDGDFHLRFGPMNTQNGRKRLNVLLTRARESIDFFCSVKSSDFKLSDNESINLLRQWIAFSENSESNAEIVFPHDLIPHVNGNLLTFDRVQTTLTQARELATLQSVLEQRGWKVHYA